MAEEVKNTKLNLSIDYRYLSMALLLIIVVMLFAWRPWSPSPTANTRTIKVSGDSKITAEPDEFVFSPTYESKNSDKAAALAELNAKTDEVTTGLKNLGVPNSKIKTTTSGYDYPTYYSGTDDVKTYSVYFTVTINNAKTAQKVQDYLVSTSPSGGVSPNATFSTAKQKALESKARDAATKEARAKAEQSAKNLGFKVGAVKSVEDNNGFSALPYASTNISADLSASTKLAIQPGENDLTYTVTVTYYLR